MSDDRINDFQKKIELAQKSPINIILEGESGVGKEHFAKLIHEKRIWSKNFVIFDWECEDSRQEKVFEDLAKNHLSGIHQTMQKTLCRSSMTPCP